MAHTVEHYENRINILKHRNKENQNIIRKLERGLRAAKEKENIDAPVAQ